MLSFVNCCRIASNILGVDEKPAYGCRRDISSALMVSVVASSVVPSVSGTAIGHNLWRIMLKSSVARVDYILPVFTVLITFITTFVAVPVSSSESPFIILEHVLRTRLLSGSAFSL